MVVCDERIRVSSKDPLSLVTFDETIIEIEASLARLKQLAEQTNFSNVAERQYYQDNVNYLKRFYERAERIARDG
jgi:hypothetical protein